MIVISWTGSTDSLKISNSNILFVLFSWMIQEHCRYQDFQCILISFSGLFLLKSLLNVFRRHMSHTDQFNLWCFSPLILSWFTSLLKIKVLYWIRWFHEEHVTFTLHKSFFKVKIHAKKIKFILRTVDWKVLCGTQMWFFFRITAKPRFGAFLKRVTRISYYIYTNHLLCSVLNAVKILSSFKLLHVEMNYPFLWTAVWWSVFS